MAVGAEVVVEDSVVVGLTVVIGTDVIAPSVVVGDSVIEVVVQALMAKGVEVLW